MQWIIWIAVGIVVFALLLVAYVLIGIRLWKRPTLLSQNIRIGMTESEMIAKIGAPKSAVIIDGNTKVLTYVKLETNYLIWSCYRETQVAVKDGVIVNISSSK